MSEDRGGPGGRGAPGAAAAAADAWACADLEAAEFTHPLPIATCTTFLPCLLACTAPVGLHTSHKYNTSLLIGIFCCVLQDPLTSILPNPPIPSLLACKKSDQSLNQNENKRISCSYCITFSYPLGSTPPCQPFAKAGSQRLSLLSGSLTVQPPQKPGRKFVWIKWHVQSQEIKQRMPNSLIVQRPQAIF